jgi:hypothetical protein
VIVRRDRLLEPGDVEGLELLGEPDDGQLPKELQRRCGRRQTEVCARITHAQAGLGYFEFAARN